MHFKYICGCKQVSLFSGLLMYRDCPKCNLPADPKKMKPVVDPTKAKEPKR